MAQTGYTPIYIYSSGTSGNTPTAGNLGNGELALNYNDGKLFYKDSSGVVQVIAGKGGAGVAGGSNTQVQYNSGGSLAGSANMTFNGTTLTLANDASISGLTVGKGAGSINLNTVVGSGALSGSNTGGYIVAVGVSALAANTTGSQTNAVGYNALRANTTGIQNNAFGTSALYSNTTGQDNQAFGQNTLSANTTGSYNVAFGTSALTANTTASNNTAVGYQAGYSNSTGVANAFFGNQAGYSTTGGYNQFFGFGAGYAVTSGNNNTILGAYSGNQGGLDIRTASNYIVLSDGAGNPRGWFDPNGNLNVYSGTTSSTLQGAILTKENGVGVSFIDIFHKSGIGSGSYYAAFEYSGSPIGTITQNGTTGVLYNIVSDQRLKENIVDAPSALSLIDSVKVRSFDFKSDGSHVTFGTIAQELYEVAPECVSKGDDGEEIERTWGVDTSVLVPALIKAIQELNAKVTALEAVAK